MDGSWTHGNQARTLGPRRLPSASFLHIASPCLAPGPGRAGTACARPPGSSVVGLACLDSLADYHPRSFHLFCSSRSRITACRLPLPYCCTGTVGGSALTALCTGWRSRSRSGPQNGLCIVPNGAGHFQGFFLFLIQINTSRKSIF